MWSRVCVVLYRNYTLSPEDYVCMMNVNSKEGSDGPLDHGWDNPGYDIDKYLTRLTNEVLPSPDNFEEPIDKRDDAPSSR